MKVYKLVLIVLLVGVGSWYLSKQFNNTIVYKDGERVVEKVVLDNLKEKIDQLKGEIINDIFVSESGNNKEEDVLITFDPHPTKKSVQVASLGNCQFKLSTVQFYEKAIYNKDISRKDALMVAISDESCKKLMTDIVFTYEDGWSNWYNSSVKKNIKSRLAIIKTLQN